MKVIRSIKIVIVIIIVIIVGLYKDSRRNIYLGRDFSISAVKKSSQGDTSYDMYCSLPRRKWGRLIKNDTDIDSTEIFFKDNKKQWQNISEFETYILLDTAEKYIDEEYTEGDTEIKNEKNECYVVTYNSYTNFGKEKSLINVYADPHEAGYIYQIIAFEYYLHKYFWAFITAVIILSVTVFFIKRKKKPS